MDVAILDDDMDFLGFLVSLFTLSARLHDIEMTVHPFSSGGDLLKKLQVRNFDLLILDRQVPEISGDDLLTWIRSNLPKDTCVIVLTSQSNSSDIVKIFSDGADDYVIKPPNPPELFARALRLLERKGVYNGAEQKPEFSLHGLDFDRGQLSIAFQGEKVLCSLGEFSLIEFLLKNSGQPLTRKRIFEAVWQRRTVPTSRALDTQIHRVRSKLELLAKNRFVLQPIYGVGYRLDVMAE